MVMVSGAATMSTRGVRISSTSMSLNSMAARISSLSWCSRPPSLSASSTMVMSSSSVMPSSLAGWKIFTASLLNRPKKRYRGVSTVRTTRMAGIARIQNFSGWSFAMVLGVISPKISTTTVRTMVEMAGP